MKKYFIANGLLLDMDMSVEEINDAVNESLDRYTGGTAQFQVEEIGDDYIRMLFIRDIKFDLPSPIIYDSDMSLITDLGTGAFMPEDFGGYPLLHPLCYNGRNFYTDVITFTRFYNALLLLSTDGKGYVGTVGIRCYNDCVLMEIRF